MLPSLKQFFNKTKHLLPVYLMYISVFCWIDFCKEVMEAIHCLGSVGSWPGWETCFIGYHTLEWSCRRSLCVSWVSSGFEGFSHYVCFIFLRVAGSCLWGCAPFLGES